MDSPILFGIKDLDDERYVHVFSTFALHIQFLLQKPLETLEMVRVKCCCSASFLGI